jgi:hypothetical protein
MTDINPMLKAAVEFYTAGCSVVPARVDGTKAPLGKWLEYCEKSASIEQIIDWFKDGHQGLGVITGEISGNLECLEIEGRAVADKLHVTAKEIAEASGLGELWAKINNGYVEQSPSGGIHWLYKIENPPTPFPGNTKIAQRPGQNDQVEVLVETRGHHGFIVTAPSGGTTHPSGKAWELIIGSPATIPTITMEEREALHDIFRALDQMPIKESLAQEVKIMESNSGKPGDDFNARATWKEILEPKGWKFAYKDSANVSYWTRPGKDFGISASTGKNDGDNLYVFTTSTSFEAQKPYSKFAAFTHLNFNGDYSGAARELRRMGYGSIHQIPEFGISPFNPNYSNSDSENDESATMSSFEDREFQFQLAKSRVARKVKKTLDTEEANKLYDRFDFVPNLEAELQMPEQEIDWVIPNLMPTGSNVTITAQYKAGKTTLVNNLAKALADGTQFLNYFKEANHPGRIVIFNYEVSEHQYRKWMKSIEFQNAGKITLVHLRGKAVPLVSDYVRNEVVEILKKLECQTWILDPFARAFTGSGDENSNSDVGVFLDQLDIIKERAGVSNLILPVHTGRAQESGIDRARGATRIDDWADVRWILKKTEDGRFFSADGRDVMLEEQMLRFDDATRHLTLGGADAKTAKKRNLEDLWVETGNKEPWTKYRRSMPNLGQIYR